MSGAGIKGHTLAGDAAYGMSTEGGKYLPPLSAFTGLGAPEKYQVFSQHLSLQNRTCVPHAQGVQHLEIPGGLFTIQWD